MTVRRRSSLFILIGIGLGVWAYQIDGCAFSNGPCSPPARFVAFCSFFLVTFFGVGPLMGRWQWKALKYQENEYYLQKWKESFDGPFGEFYEWFVGVDRDGNLKP